MRTWLRWMALLGFVGAMLWALLAIMLDAYGHRGASGSYDAIVVAGCRVEASGRPSLALKRRTRKAVELWKAGIAPKIVFTGGVGQFPPSEASAAGDYARTLGVPAEALLLEERSTSTEENAKFSAEVLASTSRVIVVTDTYHVFRAERVFGKVFAEARGAGSVASLPVRTKGAFREVLAVGGYAVGGRL